MLCDFFLQSDIGGDFNIGVHTRKKKETLQTDIIFSCIEMTNERFLTHRQDMS